MKKAIMSMFGILLFLGGALLVMYPFGREAITNYKNSKLIDNFQTAKMMAEKGNSPETEQYEQLRVSMEAYNRKIYEENQKGLCDAWSYQQNVFDFAGAGLEHDMIGYLSIQAMDIEMPVYIGATTENMEKGAVVLSQTSMPIGGENTNCVIAAHRGWKGNAMFRDIEVLQPGDEISITNLWEQIRYEVVKSIVIDPEDMDAVKILEGEDLVTLVTCHPYTKNSQRYIVYCRRSDGNSVQESEIPYHGETYIPSEGQIQKERNINYIALILMILLLAGLLYVFVIRKHLRSL